MPSRYSYAPSPPSVHLSDIIKLEPEEEPWCAGYAPSQGRRCHARTNAYGRRSAMVLLNEGTKDLRAGRSIDALLEDLAPHVLCTRFHQNQASDLTRRWRGQVHQYLNSQGTFTPSTQQTRVSSRIVDTETAESELEERIAVLQQRLRNLKEIRRLEAAESYLPITASPPFYRERRNPNAVVSSSIPTSTLSRNTPPVNRVDRTSTVQTTQSTNQPSMTVLRPEQVQISHQIRAVSPLSPRLATPSTGVHASSRTRSHDSQNRISQTTRREAEGECGICLCDLLPSKQDIAGDTDEESDHIGSDEYSRDDQSDDDDYDDEIDDDEENEEQETEDKHERQDEELAWCKARCGVNFHAKCIEQWLETARAPTCPACRSTWKH
ncbi:hypothetical protein PENANT_c011G04100 [Penicillium antarcticum]|uniref:RING-type domain-containing protein n=1 Tax=Penicillium antarcticum TaxID=416450 RepID=A0A1V6Q6W5_9EURO|nr:uncharacterized protein N7508_003200 [Penicillium antarcticum]KAJ5312370.1 hypothetical protein N7508_003200 [Penicillium antarcticum]OQD84974.1 hypothetical protein PENANT_c011G04100 [Penicillium antarcticum]